jgi:Uncharacterized protein conserved in bacteria C-term(DUF2220)/Uncharacterized protein conserved in bacteria N-term (DUF3322)
MSRRFTDAKALFGYLLDSHENGAASPFGYPDYSACADVLAIDRFNRDLRDAERHGAVRLAMGRGRNSEEVAHVRLEAAARLYTLLGRRPVGERADEASGRLLDGLELSREFDGAIRSLRKAWTQGRSWQGFSLDDADRLRPALVMAQAILEGRHRGVDYRTFSRRISGDSKALERLEAVVVRLLSSSLQLPPGARPRDALRTLGLEKFAPPLLLSGHLDFDMAELSAAAPLYFGIPPGEVGRLRFPCKPQYCLTIENFASFSRHVMEADPLRAGVTIYVGGYPSLATQQALKTLAAMLAPDVPFFHWSDIDPDGTWIFRTIERALERELTPHLMSVEIAERYGRSPVDRVRPALETATSAISELMVYLQREDAKWLEQEELDPMIPGCSIGASSGRDRKSA